MKGKQLVPDFKMVTGNNTASRAGKLPTILDNN